MTNSPSSPPKSYQRFKEKFPAVMEAYEQLGNACHWNGPLNPKTRELIKMESPWGRDWKVRPMPMFGWHGKPKPPLRRFGTPRCWATTTLGFSSMMRAMTWVNDVLEAKKE